MKLLLKAIFVIPVIVNSSFCFIPFEKQLGYKLEIKQKEYEKINGNENLTLTVTLKNNTEDTLRRVSMSCSWEDFYRIDNKDLEWDSNISECIGNLPVTITILPHKESEAKLKFKFKNRQIKFPLRFRIGLDLITDDAKGSNAVKYLLGQTNSNIIWSEMVKLYK